MHDLADAPVLSLRDRLKAKKAGADGRLSTKLPVSGITVTYPAFITHAQVMVATKIAGKNRARVGSILVAQVCLFEGERLTVDEISGDLLHNSDATHLINLIFDDEAAEADAEDGASGN